MNGSWDTPRYCQEKPDGFRWGEFRQALGFLPPAPFSLSLSLRTSAHRPRRRQGVRLVHRRPVSGVSGKVAQERWHFLAGLLPAPRGLTSSNLGLTPPPRRTKADLRLRIIKDQTRCSAVTLSPLGASQVALVVKNPPASAGDLGDGDLIPGLEAPLEEGVATHCSTLAWRIPWTEEPGGYSPGGRRVGHD